MRSRKRAALAAAVIEPEEPADNSITGLQRIVVGSDDTRARIQTLRYLIGKLGAATARKPSEQAKWPVILPEADERVA